MTKRKIELDPEAVRDFDLSEEHRRKIRAWCQEEDKTESCPLGPSWHCTSPKTCRSLFPEIIGQHWRWNNTQKCPCHVLKIRDVVKVAREAVG